MNFRFFFFVEKLTQWQFPAFRRRIENKLAMEINPLLSEVMQPGFQIVVHMKTTSN